MSKVNDTNTKITLYDWNYGDLGQSNDKNGKFTFTSAGTYKVRMVVGNGICTDTLTKTIIVVKLGGISLKERLEMQATQDKILAENQILQVLIYPNPSTGNFSLEIETLNQNTADLYFYNNLGILIAKRENAEVGMPQKFDFSNLNAGIYTLKIVSGKDVKTVNWVKE